MEEMLKETKSSHIPDENVETSGEMNEEMKENRKLFEQKVSINGGGQARFKWFLFLLMLIGQLIGLILFTIWASDCFFREFKTTAVCEDFNVFLIPKILEFLWLLITSLVAAVLICLVVWSKNFLGARKVFSHLKKQKYFYKIMLLLLVVVIYDIYVISNNPNTWKSVSYCFFILEKSITVVLMLLVNFLPNFWNNGDSRPKWWVYRTALAMFALQNFWISLLGGMIAAYKVLSVPGAGASEEGELHGPKSVISLMLLMANNVYRYTVGEFFVAKIWDEELNILGGNKIEKIRDTLDLNDCASNKDGIEIA